MRISTSYTIPSRELESLLDSAGRGASYWCENELQYESEITKIMRGGSSHMMDFESEPQKSYELTLEMIETGLGLMAQKSPQDFADILTGDADNNTGDVFLQFCIFGEIVYS